MSWCQVKVNWGKEWSVYLETIVIRTDITSLHPFMCTLRFLWVICSESALDTHDVQSDFIRWVIASLELAVTVIQAFHWQCFFLANTCTIELNVDLRGLGVTCSPRIAGSNLAEFEIFSGRKNLEHKSFRRDFKPLQNIKPEKQDSDKNLIGLGYSRPSNALVIITEHTASSRK